MFCLSDSFRFAMPVSARLEVKASLAAQKEESMRDEIMEEREQMIGDATRYEKMKTRQVLELSMESLIFTLTLNCNPNPHPSPES